MVATKAYYSQSESTATTKQAIEQNSNFIEKIPK